MGIENMLKLKGRTLTNVIQPNGQQIVLVFDNGQTMTFSVKIKESWNEIEALLYCLIS